MNACVYGCKTANATNLCFAFLNIILMGIENLIVVVVLVVNSVVLVMNGT